MNQSKSANEREELLAIAKDLYAKMTEKIDRDSLYKYVGREVIFRREDLTLEGRLYLEGEEGNHDASIEDPRTNYVLVVTGGEPKREIVTVAGYSFIRGQSQVPWDEVKRIGRWNNVHDNWCIPLKSGDVITVGYSPKMIIKAIDAFSFREIHYVKEQEEPGNKYIVWFTEK